MQSSPPRPQLGTFSAQTYRKRVENAKREEDDGGAAAQPPCQIWDSVAESLA